jgi:hypothetical protein
MQDLGYLFHSPAIGREQHLELLVLDALESQFLSEPVNTIPTHIHFLV